MPKIKGWSKKWKRKNETSWKHDEKPIEVVVESYSDGWEAWLNFRSEKYEYYNDDRLGFDKTFDSRETAERFAVRWMRRHPQG